MDWEGAVVDDKIPLREAAKRVGANYVTVSRWIREGLINLTDHPVHRQRIPVYLGPKEMRELTWLVKLRNSLSLQALRKAITYLREKLGHNPMSTGYFAVLDGKPGQKELVKICYDTGEAIQVLQNPGQMLLIPLWDEPTEPEEAVPEGTIQESE